MSAPVMLRSLAATLLSAALTGLLPHAAQANGGGGGGEGSGNQCPWQQEVTLALGAKTLHVPQSVFDGKGPPPVIDGYELAPNVNALVLRATGPRGDVWEAAMTRLAGKRCTAFYLGKAVRIDDSFPAAAPAGRDSGHKQNVATH